MSEEKARQAIVNYIEAFNAQDLPAMKDCFNFPFAWLVNDVARPVQTASEFQSPTTRLIKEEGWHHTVLDLAEPIHVWDTKAHFKVKYSRYKADGTKYLSHDAIWIVTSVDGHWGVQWMSLYLP